VRRPLKPWQRRVIVRVSMFERYQSGRAEQRARFKVGQRVRCVGGQRFDTITAIIPSKTVTRYRLAGSQFMYFEYDLTEALP